MYLIPAQCTVYERLRRKVSRGIHRRRGIGRGSLQPYWEPRYCVGKISRHACAEAAIFRYVMLLREVKGYTDQRLDMWWLGLALFVVCIIEVRPPWSGGRPSVDLITEGRP